jgi:hypothetical protein
LSNKKILGRRTTDKRMPKYEFRWVFGVVLYYGGTDEQTDRFARPPDFRQAVLSRVGSNRAYSLKENIKLVKVKLFS